MPRSSSSGALSIESNARYSASPLSARYLVIAAVSDVLPWSMWPMVPMLTCGLLRSNFFLAMSVVGSYSFIGDVCLGREWSPHWDLNPRPLPYQGSALPAELCGPWWAGRESNPHSRRRLIYSQRSSPPAQPTHVVPVLLPGPRPRWRRGVEHRPSSVGADDGTRTRNRRFTKPLLYQLSYVGGDGEGYRTCGR